MTELEALRRVADAARDWINGTGDAAMRNMTRTASALAVLDALPAEAEAEVVEVAVWVDGSGFCVLALAGSHDDKRGSTHMRRLGVTRLAVAVDVEGV